VLHHEPEFGAEEIGIPTSTGHVSPFHLSKTAINRMQEFGQDPKSTKAWTSETHDLVLEVPDLSMRLIEAQGSRANSRVNPAWPGG
jgi:hypothetical protein